MNILSGESEFDHHQCLSVTTKMAGNMLNLDVFLDQKLLRGSDEWLVNDIFVSYFRGICRYEYLKDTWTKITWKYHASIVVPTYFVARFSNSLVIAAVTHLKIQHWGSNINFHPSTLRVLANLRLFLYQKQRGRWNNQNSSPKHHQSHSSHHLLVYTIINNWHLETNFFNPHHPWRVIRSWWFCSLSWCWVMICPAFRLWVVPCPWPALRGMAMSLLSVVKKRRSWALTMRIQL